jgi:hypothetical protein
MGCPDMSSGHTTHLHRLAVRLPSPFRSGLVWVLRPEAKWLRVPLGLLLIAGGFLGFLPILGFWMLPLGALLLAEDFPLARQPTVQAIEAMEHWWAQRRNATKRRQQTHDNVHS